MDATVAGDPKVLAHYEGLVRKTAAIYEPLVQEDYDDICQILRIKVWRALLSFDPAKSRTGRDRYVFSCVKNQCKDLVKRKRRQETSLELVTSGNEGEREVFEAQYLVVTREQAYAVVEDAAPFLPSTLNAAERDVVGLLYLDFNQTEIARDRGMSPKQIATVVQSIRRKMEDWRPTASETAGRQSGRPSTGTGQPDRRAAA